MVISFFILLATAGPAILLLSLIAWDKRNRAKRIQMATGGSSESPGATNQGGLDSARREEQAFRAQLKTFAPVPWVTYSLVAANFLFWIYAVVTGASVISTPSERLLELGGLATSEVQRGEVFRLISATFLHSGVIHLALNMLCLANIGPMVERIYGHGAFALIYLGSAVIGSSVSLHFAAQSAVSVGASGAIFGIAGALLTGVLQHRSALPERFSNQTFSSIGVFIAYSLVQGFSHSGIDNGAHLGGLIGGAMVAYVLPERFDLEQFSRLLKIRVTAAAISIMTATTVLAISASPARVDQGIQPEFVRAVEQFDRFMKVIEASHKEMEAGRLTPRDLDSQSRSVHAPMARDVLRRMGDISFPQSDPRWPLHAEITHFCGVLLEILEMESSIEDEVEEPTAANPERMAELERELEASGERLALVVKNMKRGG